MNKSQNTELVNKCMKVIVSCKTREQLNGAVNYCGLAYRALSNHAGMAYKESFAELTRKSISFALCRINKNNGV